MKTTVYLFIFSILLSFAATQAQQLDFVEYQQPGTSMYYPKGVAISPDGKHVYVACNYSDSLMVYARDSSSGELTVVEYIKNDIFDADGLEGAHDIEVSPDGKHVYISSELTAKLAVYARNATTGKLTYVEKQGDMSSAKGLAISPDNSRVYLASDNVLGVYSRDTGTGQLTLLFNQTATTLSNASDVAVSSDNQYIYVTGYNSDTVVAFYQNTPTTLELIDTEEDEIGGVTGLSMAVSLSISPDGSHLYATGYQDDSVVVFSLDSDTGEMTFVTAYEAVTGILGPQRILVSPDNSHVYLSGQISDKIAVFSRNTSTGELTEVERESIQSPWGIAISPDNNHLYAASQTDDLTAVYLRNTSSGELSLIEEEQDQGNMANGMDAAVSPDGKHVYVAADNLTLFNRDASTGALTFSEFLAKDGEKGANGKKAAISADGNFVYIVSGSVDVFLRDTDTGQLAFVEQISISDYVDTPQRDPSRSALTISSSISAVMQGMWSCLNVIQPQARSPSSK